MPLLAAADYRRHLHALSVQLNIPAAYLGYLKLDLARCNEPQHFFKLCTIGCHQDMCSTLL